MYAAVTTRVDIAYSVSKLSGKLASPSKEDWIAVKRVMRYLRGREHFGISYSGEGNKGLEFHCDASFAGDEKYRSTTGCVAQLAGG